ncbi:unnamed protein product [Durusdinium trenchii]|uniref:Uncharacterized protein n=1 Tax=Durusdinium trenchii TaxID=1381693 RepID=A0ABP0IC02_9DINO
MTYVKVVDHRASCRPQIARTMALGRLLLSLAAATVVWSFARAGGSLDTFVAGTADHVVRDVQVSMKAGRSIPAEQKYRFEGATRRLYLRRLRHRRWCAQFQYPRTFGYVLKWNDTAGEGIVIDQEQTQKYLVIRDEIGAAYHKHATLQVTEFVEFFKTDEMDEESGLPLAKNVTGPHGANTKGSQDYREIMLRSGNFPKRWEDTYDDYEKKVGEWWTQPKWRCGYPAK